MIILINPLVVIPFSLLLSKDCENRVLARIEHQGIVLIFDEGVHQGFPWYTMELIEGMNVKEFIFGNEGEQYHHKTQVIDSQESVLTGKFHLIIQR